MRVLPNPRGSEYLTPGLEAFARARERGQGEAGDDGGTIRGEGQPAEWVFAGVRKLTLCEDAEKRPGDGAEITYLEMEVDSERALQDLLAGKPAEVRVKDLAHEPRPQQAAAGSMRNGA